ncbi:MAG: biosynthetic arginine decarboxylase [Pseudomonadota bacterium]|nr:MAG: biosynthetic arginine decarboxylase [Pseudomonadota bacterium]
MNDWKIEKARETYSVAHWGGGYVDINSRGRLVVRPDRKPEHDGVDLLELVDEMQRIGLALPVLVRFPGILRDRVATLAGAFDLAMQANSYRGRFTAVYPIKVNQQRRVVEEILHAGNGGVGLEAGSKPEFMAVLALSRADGGVIVCNGYKDREYIRLALIGQALGHQVYIVIEKLSELELVIEESRALGIRPMLGMRVRLASIAAGKWQNTGGEKSKFGLSARQVLQVVERLIKAEMLGALRLLHCHMGSQIANISDIQRGMRECARYYAELNRLGVDIEVVDVGGGLSVDYEGSRSRSEFSMNYSVQEYANNVVQALREVCAEHGLTHPDVITESGRALTAHHAMLVADIVGVESAPDAPLPVPGDEEHQLVVNLHEGLTTLDEERLPSRSLLEVYHDALHWMDEVQTMYTHGLLSLEQRAHAELLYAAICRRVRSLLNPGARAHREVIDDLNERLADKYFCNLSIFQSLPDIWAIDQIFPIVPLHRLDEPPQRRGILEDITCDSDGRIDNYVDVSGVDSTLPLHAVKSGERYLIGIFLAGAYQEILGDMHNLFGDTDSVHVEVGSDGSYRLLEPQKGATVDELLRYVNFEPEQLVASYRDKTAAANLDADRKKGFLEELEAGITGYTYLEE